MFYFITRHFQRLPHLMLCVTCPNDKNQRATLKKLYKGRTPRVGDTIIPTGACHLTVDSIWRCVDDKAGQEFLIVINCTIKSVHEIPLLLKSGWWEES